MNKKSVSFGLKDDSAARISSGLDESVSHDAEPLGGEAFIVNSAT